MNKQELIDKAVHEFGGEWPSVFNMPEKRSTKNGFYVTPSGTMTHKDRCEWFKESEFQQRARELGYLDAPTVKDSLTDEWYDYDNQKAIALPPVGVECLTWFDDGKECWQKCKVLALSPYEQDHMAVSLIGRYDRKLIWSQDFKPLDHNRKAEAEKKRVVDAAMKIASGGMTKEMYEALYDAGYLKLPTE